MKLFFKIGLAVLIIAAPMDISVASGGNFFFMENPLVGKPAPDFTLKTLNSGEQNLTKFRNGQPAILFFWATWCPHCRENLKGINETQGAQIEKNGVKLILVDLEETPAQVKSYTGKNKIQYDVWLDEESSLSDKYALVGVPTFIFIDKEGIVRAVEHSLPENYTEILKMGHQK